MVDLALSRHLSVWHADTAVLANRIKVKTCSKDVCHSRSSIMARNGLICPESWAKPIAIVNKSTQNVPEYTILKGKKSFKFSGEGSLHTFPTPSWPPTGPIQREPC